MNVGIILAAGHGERFGSKIPKQFCLLNNKQVIDYSISAFENSKLIDHIIIVVPKKWIDEIQKKYPNHLVLPGGKNRSDSSFISLTNCPANTVNVLIHDSARPFITTSLINKCLLHLDNNDAVIVSSKATDTVIRVADNKTILNVENREELYLNQTPQGFKYNLILHAHQKSNSLTTDDLSLINLHENKCLIINGPRYNIKITEYDDIKIAESILNNIK